MNTATSGPRAATHPIQTNEATTGSTEAPSRTPQQVSFVTRLKNFFAAKSETAPSTAHTGISTTVPKSPAAQLEALVGPPRRGAPPPPQLFQEKLLELHKAIATAGSRQTATAGSARGPVSRILDAVIDCELAMPVAAAAHRPLLQRIKETCITKAFHPETARRVAPLMKRMSANATQVSAITFRLPEAVTDAISSQATTLRLCVERTIKEPKGPQSANSTFLAAELSGKISASVRSWQSDLRDSSDEVKNKLTETLKSLEELESDGTTITQLLMRDLRKDLGYRDQFDKTDEDGWVLVDPEGPAPSPRTSINDRSST